MKKNSMKESNLKIGIAGYGYVGKIRKRILDTIPGIKIVAISDKNPKNGIFSKQIKFFKSYKNLFKENLDVLFISLPNKYAADATTKALKKILTYFVKSHQQETLKN